MMSSGQTSGHLWVVSTCEGLISAHQLQILFIFWENSNNHSWSNPAPPCTWPSTTANCWRSAFHPLLVNIFSTLTSTNCTVNFSQCALDIQCQWQTDHDAHLSFLERVATQTKLIWWQSTHQSCSLALGPPSWWPATTATADIVCPVSSWSSSQHTE